MEDDVATAEAASELGLASCDVEGSAVRCGVGGGEVEGRPVEHRQVDVAVQAVGDEVGVGEDLADVVGGDALDVVAVDLDGADPGVMNDGDLFVDVPLLEVERDDGAEGQ